MLQDINYNNWNATLEIYQAKNMETNLLMDKFANELTCSSSKQNLIDLLEWTSKNGDDFQMLNMFQNIYDKSDVGMEAILDFIASNTVLPRR